jgi:pimeloyl-ACP methyl ester carboxylesterase
MSRIQVNGLQIEHDTFGDESRDPVLLIMGLGTQMIGWSSEFCESLAAHGHYVIRFDNRDVGLSAKFDGVRAPGRLRYVLHRIFGLPLGAPYSLEDMASDAACVLDALGITAAHVVGASMGGMIAQLMSVRYPQRVKTLTSIMSTSGAAGLPRARDDIMQHVFVNRPDTGDIDAMLEHMLKTMHLISSPAFPRSESEWRELLSEILRRSFYPQGFRRQLAAIVEDGSRVERLRTIDKPTLVIHGSEDPLIPVECGIDTARHIEGARLEIIEGMGHDLPPPLVGRLTRLIAEHASSAVSATPGSCSGAD